MARLDTPVLCFVTDRRRCAGRPLEDVVEQAIAGGVNMVQLREKDLSADQLYDLGIRLKEVIHNRAKLIVNDRLDVALAIDADGVQLPENGLPTAIARRLVGPGLLIGRSVHTVKAALHAESNGADFLIAGTIFPSKTHPDGPTQGTELLRQVIGKVSIPILAIGGISSDNVGQAMQVGASGAAVITAISEADEPRIAARSLVDEIARSYRK